MSNLSLRSPSLLTAKNLQMHNFVTQTKAQLLQVQLQNQKRLQEMEKLKRQLLLQQQTLQMQIDMQLANFHQTSPQTISPIMSYASMPNINYETSRIAAYIQEQKSNLVAQGVVVFQNKDDLTYTLRRPDGSLHTIIGIDDEGGIHMVEITVPC